MLSDLGADEKPVIYVFNKADIIGDSLILSECGINSDDAVYISARTGMGIDKLIRRISEIVLSGRTRETFLNSEYRAWSTFLPLQLCIGRVG